MIEAIVALGGVVLVQFGLLWYRIGRVEGKLDEHCRHDGGKDSSLRR